MSYCALQLSLNDYGTADWPTVSWGPMLWKTGEWHGTLVIGENQHPMSQQNVPSDLRACESR
jgi:hypothetical protein